MLYLMVKSNIHLFVSEGKFLLLYRSSCNILIFEASSLIIARRFCLYSLKELQSGKKCFVSFVASFVGHIGLIVSLKLEIEFSQSYS